MELRHFRYFIAVAEELSFTRAAERLHTSQPSLSEQIRNLETEVGAMLLRRTRRKVELTDVGRIFLEEARLVMRQFDDALARTRKAAQRKEDVLTIGFVPAAEVRIFPTALTELRLLFPKVGIVLRSLTSEQLQQALAHDEVDIAFMRQPLQGFSPLGEVVLREQINIFIRADHPLAREQQISPRQLNGLRYVGIDRHHARTLHDITETYLERHEIRPKDRQLSSNVLMSMNLVSAGFDYALLPSYAETFSPKNVVSRPLTGERAHIDLIMVASHADTARSEAARSLMQIVRDTCLESRDQGAPE
ncbi:MAG: LysR family transcriptional regulator [Sphingomonadales bacterium]|nr:MAG: LysR family transcriptional regulator [Sphingomonadales bacterium]TNF03439.1 MAG: LysR family transcriptional regulator [Sphingomonadales bacterium]